MLLAVLTASGDLPASASALTDAEFDGLFAALQARGHEVVDHDVAGHAVTGHAAAPDAVTLMASAAEAGRQAVLARVASGGPPHVVLCDGVVSGLAAHAVGAATGAPVVLWTGSADLPSDATARRMALAVLQSCSLVLASSPAVAAVLEERRLARRIVVVSPAVDTTTFDDPGWRESDGSAGASPMVVRVVGQGAGAFGDRLRSDLPDVAVEAVEVRRGTVKGAAGQPGALREALRSADVVVTGLGGDGGRATLRAMACARPVITFDRLPDSDIVLDGASGVVLRHPDELAATVHALVQDPFRREALGQGALDRVLGAHTAAAVAARLESELAAVCSPSGVGRTAG